MTTITTENAGRFFKDLDLNFIQHPIKKDINKHIKENAVIYSVKNLLMTNFYEVPFKPEMGSNIRRLLFEPIDHLTTAQLQRAITETIENYEPRVSLKTTRVTPYPDDNKYMIDIEFYIINSPNPVNIKFFLERIR